jgi:Transposase
VEAYDGPQIVGMDLHRRRSVLVRMTEDGKKLDTARIANSPARLAAEIRRAGLHPKVVLEACYGWYWAADTLAAAGAEVHLAHPLGVKAFARRRVKNDELDARDLADLLRMGRLADRRDHRAEAGDRRAAGRASCHCCLASVHRRAVRGRQILRMPPSMASYRSKLRSPARFTRSVSASSMSTGKDGSAT